MHSAQPCVTNGVRRWTQPAVGTFSVTRPDGIDPNSREEIQLILDITASVSGQLFQLNSAHWAGLSVYVETRTQPGLYVKYTNSKSRRLNVGEGGIVNLTITIQTDDTTTLLSDSLSDLNITFASPEPNSFQLQIGNGHAVKTVQYSTGNQLNSITFF